MVANVLLLSRILLHNNDMDNLLTLYYSDVAPMQPFHSASVTLKRRGEANVARHCHDFHEILLVVEGAGIHWLNGHEYNLSPGDMFLLRPDDRHGLELGSRPRLHFMNVAFPSEAWSTFSELALPIDVAAAWREPQLPPTGRLAGERFDRAVSAFRRLSQLAGQSEERLELMRFWMEVTDLLINDSALPASPSTEGPEWLERALASMTGPDALRAGVPALVQLCGVSAAHVSRTLKGLRGQTPTQFVNGVRLRRAALLLANSSLEIVDIALECGFENLSYFYRQFHAAFGRPPRAYRIAERSRIAPHSATNG